MTFSDWPQRSPDDAARELHRRIRALPPAQQRAVIARVTPESELAQRFAAADRTKPLGGVPFLVKDLFDVADEPTFAGSTFLPEVRATPTRDATIVTALRAAGAILAGKTQMHEFAYGITGENPHSGDCEHPAFPGRTTGGSSSGSAAAVAAGIVPLALGSDTGGSVRVPAAFCGLHGFRLAPADPLIADAVPLAPSFDTAGWFTRTAADMLAALDALVEPAHDTSTPRGLYLELPGLDADVSSALRLAALPFAPVADRLAATDLLAGFSRSVDTYNAIVAAEAWRFHEPWAERYRDRYDPAVWQRLQRGVTQPRADYERALIDLTAVRLLWTRYFARYDFLLMPATPFGALTKADCTLANRGRLLALTAPASLGGFPVLTLPVPLPSGLTTGLQFVVPHPKNPALRWALAQPRR